MIANIDAARARTRAKAAGTPVLSTYQTGYAVGGVNAAPAATERGRAYAHAWEKAYAEAFGRTVGRWEAADAAYFLAQGMTEAVIIAAIGAARSAPMPSWRYAVAVMRRCLAANVRTKEGWYMREEQHEARKPKQKEEPIYTKADLLALVEGIE